MVHGADRAVREEKASRSFRPGLVCEPGNAISSRKTTTFSARSRLIQGVIAPKGRSRLPTPQRGLLSRRPMRSRPLLLLLLAACTGPKGGNAPASAAVSTVLADSEIPAGPLGASLRRGLAQMPATRESLPANAGSGLRCVSCHLDEGRRSPQ